MDTFEITFLVDSGTEKDPDIEIKKTVAAEDKQRAIDRARLKLRRENPEIDCAKATALQVQKVYI